MWPSNLSSTVVLLQTLLEEVFIVVTICLLPHFVLKRYDHKTKIAFTFLKHKGHCYLGISTVVTWVLDELERNIRHICHGRHGRRPCKFFLAGVNFFRLNAKNWRFLQI